MTRAGQGTLTAGLLIAVAGLYSGYPALTAMGATLLISVVIALLLVGRKTDLHAERRVRPDRVTTGDPASSVLTITNRGRSAMGRSVVHEHVGDQVVTIDLPPLDPDESTTVEHELPTERRGIYQVGPLTVRRGDPIGLARRGDTTSELAQLIVYPYIHTITPFPAGMRRDLEGLPSGEAAEGGITFSNLREYVPGDDLRLVHWRSSARVGELMVRQNIDVHRPGTTVILDTSADVYDDESFEDAVRAAASVIAAAMTRRFPFTLRTIDGQVINDRASNIAVMDFLAAVKPSTDTKLSIGSAALAASRDPAGLSCATITGRAGVDALQSLGPLRNKFDQLTMIRMGSVETAQVYQVGGATLINAGTSTDFAQAWSRGHR